ncbi:MAG: divalent metal cation transporter, partial [Chthoniobacter sp.]|nr:divalent metal cation transporter [Chthoniobacter sp.]
MRARDRLRVQKTRAQKRWLRLLWLLAGPGVLVMLGENDGPSMVSYATTGATYGVGFFVPFILLTFLMAFVVQEMTVRLGVATHRGHSELIFQRFGPFWGYFAMGDLVFGNLLTLVTEFISIQAVGLYFRRKPGGGVGATGPPATVPEGIVFQGLKALATSSDRSAIRAPGHARSSRACGASIQPSDAKRWGSAKRREKSCIFHHCVLAPTHETR